MSKKNDKGAREDKIKKDLEDVDIIHQSFDISSFAESKNQLSKYTKGFPMVNAPTIQLMHDSVVHNKNIRLLEKTEDPAYREDLTARNQYNPNSPKDADKLIEQIESLQAEVQTYHSELALANQKKDILTQQVGELEKKVSRKDDIIRQQQKVIDQLKANSMRSSKKSSSSECNVESLCLEMLSPEDTASLLSKLLRKGCKSSRIVRILADDSSAPELLRKMISKE